MLGFHPFLFLRCSPHQVPIPQRLALFPRPILICKLKLLREPGICAAHHVYEPMRIPSVRVFSLEHRDFLQHALFAEHRRSDVIWDISRDVDDVYIAHHIYTHTLFSTGWREAPRGKVVSGEHPAQIRSPVKYGTAPPMIADLIISSNEIVRPSLYVQPVLACVPNKRVFDATLFTIHHIDARGSGTI
jgi:hypothetical protein